MSFETMTQSLIIKLRSEVRELRVTVNEALSASGTAPSSEVVSGLIQIATQAEATAGTSDARAITPLKLQSRLVAFAQPLSSSLTTLAGVTSGTTGRALLTSATAAAAKTTLALTKADVGLANVDNTTDVAKPVSTAQQTALNLKANQTAVDLKADTSLLASKADLSSPAFSGAPTAPTAVSGTNTTQLSTTAFVSSAITSLAQPLSANLTSLAGVASSTVGRSLLTALDAAAAKSALILTKSDVGLGNVDNTSDANAPVSTAMQTSLNLKAALASPAFTGIPSAPTPAEGTNTTQLATTAFATAAISAFAQPLNANLTTLAGIVSGVFGRTLLGTADAAAAKTALGLSAVATSGSASDLTTGTLSSALLPPLAIHDTFVVATQAAMLALTAQRGDIAKRTDLNGQAFILQTDAPATLANWVSLNTTSDVMSVNGQTGAVNLSKADVGLSNVDNTSDTVKPVSTAQQTALNLKLNSADVPTKASLGLANVDNTSDLAKPVSTAQQTALNLKLNSADAPTKTSLGLANVDNTSDLTKPVSTATQTVLNLKLNSADTPTKTSLGLANVDNTSDVNKPVSTAQQTALNLKLNSTDAPTKTSLGLANVDNTSDVNKPVSTAQQTALNLKSNRTANLVGFGQLETHGTYADFNAITDFGYHYVQGNLNGPGIIGGLEQYYCVSLSLGSEYTYAQYVCQVAYKRNVPGKMATRYRENGTWGPWSIVGNTPTKADVGLGNVDNTSDLAKPVSTAQQTALDLKANLASPALSGTPTAPTASAGVSTTQLATTAFVSSATGVLTKVSVGLANVDNTSDVAKPVSTETQSALNLKANLDSPGLIGVPTAPTATQGTITNQLATTNYVEAAIGQVTSGALGIIDGGGPVEGAPGAQGVNDGGPP